MAYQLLIDSLIIGTIPSFEFLPHHQRKHSSVLEVADLHLRPQSAQHLELHPIWGFHFYHLPHFQVIKVYLQANCLLPRQLVGLSALAFQESQGKDSHSDQVAAVDSLETLG